jgi:hypothetical protein
MDVFIIFIYKLNIKKIDVNFIEKIYNVILINKNLNKILNFKLNNYLNEFDILSEEKPLKTCVCHKINDISYFLRNKYKYLLYSNNFPSYIKDIMKYNFADFRALKNFKPNKKMTMIMPVSYVEKYYKEILNIDINLYRIIPRYLKTHEISSRYIVSKYSNIYYIPKNQITRELFIKYIRKKFHQPPASDYLNYIYELLLKLSLNDDYYVYLYIIKNYPEFIRFVPNKYRTIHMYKLVSKNIYMHEYISNKILTSDSFIKYMIDRNYIDHMDIIIPNNLKKYAAIHYMKNNKVYGFIYGEFASYKYLYYIIK